MDDWRRAVNDYQNGVQSIAQANLQSKESLLESKAGLITGKESMLEGMTGEKFSDKLKEEASKFQEDLGLDFSTQALAPTILRGASRLASWRANALNRSWKTTQATRFNEQENAENISGDAGTADAPSVSATEPTRTPGFGSVDETDPFQPGMGTRIPISSQRVGGRVKFAPTEEEPEPITQVPDDGAVPTLTDAADTPFTDSLPSFARGIGARGAAMRQYARGGLQGGTSDNIGDAINDATGQDAPRAPTTLSQTDISDDPAAGTGLKLSTEVSDDIQGDVYKAAQQASKDADGLTTGAEDAATGAEEEAGGLIEDLAPEISAASSAWSSVAGVLGDAIPVVGFGLGLYSAISSGLDLSKTIKDEDSDPYAGIRGQLASAQSKITGLQTDVSADEFASKLGARAPSYGSLAASPQMTSQMGGIALHI